jgi:DNA-packaging protein gp3
MTAPKGNRFWEARSSHGREPKFSSAETLEAACYEYFDWVESNPLWECKAFASQGVVTTAELPKMRAMTIAGLCIYLDIDPKTWQSYGTREEFAELVRKVEAIIRTQKFTGAAADLLNQNIIARELGLADRSEVTGKDGEALMPDASPRDLARAVLDIIHQAKVEQE